MPGPNESVPSTENLEPLQQLQVRGSKADPPGDFRGRDAVDNPEIAEISSVKKAWNLLRRRSSENPPSLAHTENSQFTETQNVTRDEDSAPIDFVSEITEVSNQTQNSTRIRHTVKFNSVEVREHAYTLGSDSRHPDATTSGPPIDLSWDAHSKSIVSVDDYEASRGPRREINMLRKSEEERFRILKDAGYHSDELQAASSIATTGEIRTNRSLEGKPALYEDFHQQFKVVEEKKKPFSIIRGLFQTRQRKENKLRALDNM